MQTCGLRYFIFAALIISATFRVRARESKIDSLRAVLEKTNTDSAAINILNRLAVEFENINFDSCFHYAHNALARSLKIRYLPGVVDAYLALGKYNTVVLNKTKASLTYYARAKKILEQLIALPGQANKHLLKKKLAGSLIGIGLCYHKSGYYLQALESFNQSLRIAEYLGNSSLTGRSLHNMGLVQLSLGNYSKALELELKSLKLQENSANKNSLASIKNNLGNIYCNLKNYKKGLEYFFGALALLEGDEKSDKDFVSLTHVNIGIVYSLQKKYPEALRHFFRSLELNEKYRIKSALTGCYNNIGCCYTDQGKPDIGLEYFFKALKASNGKRELSVSLRNIGMGYAAKKNYGRALPYAQRSLAVAEELGSLELRVASEQVLSSIYKEQGNTAQALQHYEVLKSLNDSIFNGETARRITQLEMNEEFEKRQTAEKAKQYMAALRAQQQLNEQKLIRNRLGIIFGLTLLIAITVIVNYRNKSRANKLLALKTEELYQQKTMDLLREEQLKTMINVANGQEVLKSRIARDLHDGVGGALAGIKLKLLHVSESTNDGKPELERIIGHVDNLYQEVRNISHGLAPPQLKNSVFTEVVRQLTEELNGSAALKISLDYLEEDALNNLPEEVQVAVYRMIQELLKNCVQHSKCTRVEINLSKYEKELNLLVEDNGSGFNSSKKTFGIGLQNIQARVKALHGVLLIDSRAGRGSAFNITLPC